MLARVLDKSKVDKKKKYKVQDIEAPADSANGIFNDIESKRIQDYPQLSNVYSPGEIVCALWLENKGALCLLHDRFVPAMLIRLGTEQVPNRTG